MDYDFQLTELKRTQLKMLELLQVIMETKAIPEIYDMVDLQRILKVSPRTLATWRSEGILPFSQVGHKLYVTKEDLNKFLNDHKTSAI